VSAVWGLHEAPDCRTLPAVGLDRHLHDPDATLALGRELGANAQPGALMALVGDLGAGKTLLTQGIAAGLGYAGQVTSPTFTLVHEYFGGRQPLFHFDFYRPDHAEELVALGWDDYLDGSGVVVVEWADRFPSLMPAETRWIALDHDGTGRRATDLPGPPANL